VLKFLIKIFVILLCLLFTPNIVLAAASISITNLPSSITAYEGFDISINATNLDAGANYYIKSSAGDGSHDVETWTTKTSEWLALDAQWEKMSEFTANESTTSASVKARFKRDISGDKQIKVVVRKVGTTTDYDSNLKTINVLAATPEPTQESTSTPSPSPTPTPTKSPTPKPTKTPTPIPTKTPDILGKETENPDRNLLSADDIRLDISPSPAALIKSNKLSSIPPYSLIIVASGIIFLGLAGYSFFASKKTGYNISDGEKDQNSGQ
jgi:hypothetical protein